MKNTKIRQSNIELLRIVSMIMIVGLHYFNGTMGGGALGKLTTANNNYYVTYLFESLFVISVGCFVLITGYFQIEKSSITLSKVIQLFIQVTFYGLLFLLIATIARETPFKITHFAGVFLLSFVGNWFAKVYIILYILSPFLNICLTKLDKSAYKKFLIIMLILFSVWPSFLPYSPVTDNGYGIITFILFYAIGGYIKIHYVGNHSKKYYLSGYIVCALITFILTIKLPTQFNLILGYNFVFNIAGSIFMFLFFTKLNIKSKKINYISASAFGVFLIHTNGYLKDFIYEKILHCSWFWFSPLFALHAIISIVIVYSLCTLVDICRRLLFNRASKYILPFAKRHIPVLWHQIP